ncbi:LysR family transcriptional regulator [Paraburkholderia silvatlantica]|uniref:LysR family transcriptional regulator n=1 Tax=Paraburkholderia silvatlantica TaxID=321895 RepID=UPI0037535D4A
MNGRSATLDLNLLVYFEALFIEGQVSRAADRVQLSQPAMSLALKRLREMFDDPLFVHTSQGMVPTTRACELIEPVRNMLQQSRELLEQRKTFDPGEAAGTFLLVATDYVASLVLPGIIQRLQVAAPRAHVTVTPPKVSQLKRWFEEGKVELGLGYAEQPPRELHTRALFTEHVVCLVRNDHDSIRGSLSLEQLCAFPHVEVRSMRKPSYAIALEEELAERGCQLRSGLIVSDPGVARDVVEVTDMLAIVPGRLARRYAQHGRLQVLPLPFELPALTLSMLWHARTHHDPMYKWLRAEVMAVCARL